MSVEIEIPIGEIEEEPESASKTYKLDLNSGRISGMIDGREAAEQAIRKALATLRYGSLIYDDQYGNELGEMIRDGEASRELIEESVPGMVRDALLPDTRVIEVSDFLTEFKDDGVYISFTAETIFGIQKISGVKI